MLCWTVAVRLNSKHTVWEVRGIDDMDASIIRESRKIAAPRSYRGVCNRALLMAIPRT